jgi:double-stranded uracil-DNA glycosylase
MDSPDAGKRRPVTDWKHMTETPRSKSRVAAKTTKPVDAQPVDEASAVLAGFPPVVAADTQTMIFGSFPGVASLSATQYYAHPQNQFWRLLGTVLDEPLSALAYDDRLERLLAHRIGVWDVLAACERTGSLDSAIRNASPNDFVSLRRHAPALRRVCFNGKTAGRFEPVMREAGYETLVLPSSSPAHAMLSFEQKLALWKAIALPPAR